VTNNDSPGPAQSEAGPAPGRSWRLSELVPDISRRLSRSTTIALLLSPFGILFIAVVRLLIISNYNTTTALAIASSGGYVNTLLGSVIPMLPVLMPYLALVLLFFNRVILGLLSLAAAALTSPAAIRGEAFLGFLRESWHDISRTSAGFGLLALAAFVSLLLLILLVTRGLGIFSRSLATICSIILLPIVLRLYPLPDSNSYYAHLVRQPWLPTESISLSSGDSVVGYILSEDQDWVTVLNDRDRHIYYYHAEQIGQRQICQSSAVPVTLPLISLLPQASPPTSVIPKCNAKGTPAVTGLTVTRGRSQTPPGA
jgi:hypothetical protein